MSALAVAWALAVPGVTGAIVGARRPEQVDDWLPAGDLELDDEALAEIERRDRGNRRRDGRASATTTCIGCGRMKTALGIWAFSSMVTRFVPGGYQPEHAGETTVERVRRAVDGLGDLIDGYEFHYPQELNEENVDAIREALGPDHDIYCLAGGLHLDPRFGRGGLVNPDPEVRGEAVKIAVAGAEALRRARRADDRLARDRGLQLPVPDALRGQLGPGSSTASAEVAGTLDDAGQELWLEHKNSEPAMKILMRNIGMTLFVIHELARARPSTTSR